MKHKTNAFQEEYCYKNQSPPYPGPPKIPHRAPPPFKTYLPAYIHVMLQVRQLRVIQLKPVVY